MKKAFIHTVLTVILICPLFAPIYVQAAEIRTDKNAVVNKDEVVVENVYLVGGEPKMIGTVASDVFIAGNHSEVLGSVKGDVMAIGTNLNIKGDVGGDVRAIGGVINIENNIGGDLVLIGSEIFINENTKVGGDLILIGGVVNIKNSSDKKVRVVSGSTIISGKILGTANITSDKILVTKNSEISGSLIYFSPRQAVLEEGSKISGNVNFNKVDSIRENGLVKHTIVSFLNFWMLFRFITVLILTFILVYVFKIFSQKTALSTINNFWKSLAVGVIAFLFVPLIVIILLVSLILIPVSALLIMIYVGVFMISTSIAGIALGALIKKTFTKSKNLEVSFSTATIGVILLTLLQFVPFVGDITRFVFILAALGSIWIYLYEKVRWGNLVSH